MSTPRSCKHQPLYRNPLVVHGRRCLPSIPEKWRNILDECCVEAGKWEQENAENDEASMIEFLKDKGVEWNDVDIDAFTEACAPVYDWIVDEYGADPELHQKLVDFLNDYRAKNE